MTFTARINTAPVSYTENALHLARVHCYPLSPTSTFEVWCNPLGQLKGVWCDGPIKVEVSPQQIQGIPREAVLSAARLKRFLQDTYVIIRPTNEGSLFRILPRIRGGGNSFSSFGQGHTQTVALPTRTNYNYNQGFPIRAITYEPVQPGQGSFVDLRGGLYQRTFSVVFQSDTHRDLRPLVTIKVHKKDVYAGSIQKKTANKNRLVEEIRQPEARIATLLQIIRDLGLQLGEQKNQLKALQEELQHLKTSCQRSLQELNQDREALENAQQKMRKDAGRIVALMSFLDVSACLGIITQHEAIIQFQRIRPQISSLVENMPASDHLLSRVLEHLPVINAQANLAQGVEVVALIGATGVGKSTIANSLLGIPLEWDDNDQKVIVNMNHEEIARIGHGLVTSETLYTQVCRRQGFPVVADCGGFFDTRRNEALDVVALASVKYTLQQARGVKLVLCVDVQNILSNRGTIFTETLTLCLSSFFSKHQQHKSSFVLALTKPPTDLAGNLYRREQALARLRAMAQEVQETPAAALYDFILRDNGKYVLVYSPLVAAHQESFLRLLGEMSSIPQASQAFEAPYAKETQERLLGEMVDIANQTEANWQNGRFLEKVRTSESALKTFQEKISLKKTEIHNLKEKMAQEDKEQTKEQRETGRLQREVDQKRQKIANKESDINVLNTEDLVSFTSRGGEFCRQIGIFSSFFQ